MISYCIPKEHIEDRAMEQINAIANLPCLANMAIMPDVHAGYDAPIGSVVQLDGYVSPGMVGYDIGCGVTTMLTPYTEKDLKLLTKGQKNNLFVNLMSLIPTSYHTHQSDEWWKEDCVTPFDTTNELLKKKVSQREREQYGTLGAGNHFLEVGVERGGHVCITVHSGSRRSGWEIGNFWMKRAKTHGTTFGNLSMFEINSKDAHTYMEDYTWATRYARNNRMAILTRAAILLGLHPDDILKCQYIHTVHNMVVPENNNIITHRKGATPAYGKQLGLVPGNMRDGVFIVSGRGNDTLLNSCSHGAGRVMSRRAAQKLLDPATAFKGMEEIHYTKTKDFIDEAPGAYKDINYVLGLQDGVNINVINHIKPIVGLKG